MNLSNITKDLKFAKIGWFMLKHFPKLCIAGAVAAVGNYAYQFMELQKKQYEELKVEVAELKTQNQAVIAANEAMSNDMKTIKEGMESFNDSIIKINKNTQTLSQQFNSTKFQQELKGDLPQAQIDFNAWFNSYLQDINNDTLNFNLNSK